ncbi:hypothetical protein HDU76_001069 [Blyttiomyces sp. JEL0837]|nr:hypothetical protein HDU76_001069 [Blyttiomyces sp. JEL0837]
MYGSPAYKLSLSRSDISQAFPFPPNAQGRKLTDNFKHVNGENGFAISGSLMKLLMESSGQIRSLCMQDNSAAIALTQSTKSVNGKVFYHKEFASLSSDTSGLLALDDTAVITVRVDPKTKMAGAVSRLLQPGDDRPIESETTNICQSEIEMQQESLIKLYSDLLSGVSTVAIIGFPDHSNKGDSAIWVGERILLQRLGIHVAYICRTLQDYNATQLQQNLGLKGSSKGSNQNVAILFHGGGNFGDLYTHHQDLRSEVTRKFPHVRIVGFPQTLHFSTHRYLNKVTKAYSSHPNLTLVARDLSSFGILRKHFKEKHRVELAPDCAFMIGSRKEKRISGRWAKSGLFAPVDVLVHQRTDKEGKAEHRNAETWSSIGDDNALFRVDDWIGWDLHKADKLTDWDERALWRLDAGFEFLSRGKFLVTNRLHGHILATLLDIPHVLLDNLHGKVLGYYSTWTRSCAQVRFAKSVNEAIDLAHKWRKYGQWIDDVDQNVPLHAPPMMHDKDDGGDDDNVATSPDGKEGQAKDDAVANINGTNDATLETEGKKKSESTPLRLNDEDDVWLAAEDEDEELKQAEDEAKAKRKQKEAAKKAQAQAALARAAKRKGGKRKRASQKHAVPAVEVSAVDLDSEKPVLDAEATSPMESNSIDQVEKLLSDARSDQANEIEVDTPSQPGQASIEAGSSESGAQINSLAEFNDNDVKLSVDDIAIRAAQQQSEDAVISGEQQSQDTANEDSRPAETNNMTTISAQDTESSNQDDGGATGEDNAPGLEAKPLADPKAAAKEEKRRRNAKRKANAARKKAFRQRLADSAKQYDSSFDESY